MRCADDASLWAYARGELAAEARAEVDSHLTSCARCSEALARVQASRVLLQAAATVPPKVNWSAVDRAVTAGAASRLATRPWWRPRATAVAALSAAAALAIVLIGLWGRHRAEIIVEAAAGAGLLEAPARGGVVKAGTVLGSGATVHTGEGGSALLRLPDSSRASLGARTRATFTRADRKEIEIDLARGSVAIEAAHVERERFVVRAGLVRVAVAGTVFRVERRDEQVTVAVGRGRVRVDAEGRPGQFIDAGQRLVMGAEGTSLAESALTTEDGEAFEHLGFITPPRDTSNVRPEPVANASGGAPSTPASPAGSRSRPERKRPSAKHPSTAIAQPVQQSPAVADSGYRAPAPDTAAPAAPGIGGLPAGSVPSSALVPGGGGSSGLDTQWAMPSFRSPSEPPAPPPSLAERARTSGLPITAEGLFLQRVKESIGESSCQQYLGGLAEVIESSRDQRAREMGRILRARCFDEMGLRGQADLEYRRYLEQFPLGRFAAEARGALRR